EPVLLPAREEYSREHFRALLEKDGASTADRVKGAMGIAWWNRHDAGRTIDVSSLRLGDAILLHLPGEALIRWQLLAQRMAEAAGRGASLDIPAEALSRPEEAPRAAGRPFLAAAAYGDCGPAYFPTAESYPRGGYEVSMAWVSPRADPILRAALRKLLAP
ncbi:MAG: hypothetical protein JXA90_10280, partial [Planctomycetes bacterium]|nr:hypothetical protein [Planctomycetota bacterium]